MAFGNYYNPYNPYGSAFPPQMLPPQMPQPSIPQPPAAPPMQNGFVWVDGLEEANGYYVAPNTAVQLWDKNSPTIYKKSADSAGKPTMQIFDLVERVPAPPVQPAGDNYVARHDFELLSGRVDLIEKLLKEAETRE